jgi:hypothetical protein
MDLEAMTLEELQKLEVRIQAEIDCKLMRMPVAPYVHVSILGDDINVQ